MAKIRSKFAILKTIAEEILNKEILKIQIELENKKDILLIDSDLINISSNHTIDYYLDETNIPNQALVNQTITYFDEGERARFFKPLEFLNLLDKQYNFVKINYQNGEKIINHLKSLKLSLPRKHVLFGFILKWFGGYPVNNMNEDFDKMLKLIQSEFLSYEHDTPEKEFCKADQNMRNKFEKYGIAFTTAINNNLDVNEVLSAMELDNEV